MLKWLKRKFLISLITVSFSFGKNYLAAHFEQKAVLSRNKYEGWNFNSGSYLFTTDTK